MFYEVTEICCFCYWTLVEQANEYENEVPFIYYEIYRRIARTRGEMPNRTKFQFAFHMLIVQVYMLCVHASLRWPKYSDYLIIWFSRHSIWLVSDSHIERICGKLNFFFLSVAFFSFRHSVEHQHTYTHFKYAAKN